MSEAPEVTYVFEVYSGRGFVRFDLTESKPDRPFGTGRFVVWHYSGRPPGDNDPGSYMEYAWWCFKFGADERFFKKPSQRERYVGAWLPIWAPMGLLSTPLCFSMWRIWRRSRAARSSFACLNCGYDLRAGHDKCPECGEESHVKVGAAVG